ncbi:S9 family peptidase [Candidatus Binatus sp.]|uniref:S9 family peptidase n=1 Tax=Candidatus Binatus sp. TaxID=2811406 RepID=UPI002F94754C
MTSAISPPASFAQSPPLIPRDTLLGNPERANPHIAPDGKRLAWLAPDEHEILQVWVRTVGQHDARVVTADKRRGIQSYGWAFDSKTILYAQDAAGDENFHLFAVDLDSHNIRDLTPWEGVRSGVVASSPKFPGRILVALNLRNRKLMDVYRIDLRTGAVELDTQNPGDVAGWLADDDLIVRAATVTTPDGGTELRIRDSAAGPWRTLMKAAMEDNLAALDLSLDGQSIFLSSSIGTDTARLVRHEIASGMETVVAHSDDADLSDAMIQPTRHVVQAAAFDPGRMHWTVVDPSVQADFDAIAKITTGDFTVVDRDLADHTWLVSFVSDRAPARYYSWDRAARKATFLFSTQPKLDDAPLAAMKPVEFAARDGMKINGYLTLPVGAPPKNLPLVLAVHGGPWARDSWGFNPYIQLLANRGYAVLQINFRGSTGFGKKYLHAGDRQWGLKMQSDLSDGVKWAVDQAIADPKRVAIFGGSYGGYAALAGAAFTPELYRCAVDECGPSNLFTLLESFPPYWEVARSLFFTRVGNPGDPKDKELLTAASPLFSADKIKIPMLIGQGANDPRVKQAEAEQIVDAIARHHGSAAYVLYADEGHGFVRPENRLDFTARMEKFLADNLGGRYEPMKGDSIPGATAKLRVVGASPPTHQN